MEKASKSPRPYSLPPIPPVLLALAPLVNLDEEQKHNLISDSAGNIWADFATGDKSR